MAPQLDSALAGAALSGSERRIVERIVVRLREELGSALPEYGGGVEGGG